MSLLRFLWTLSAVLLGWPGTSAIAEGLLAVSPPEGRLAIVVDGNSPDPDDIGATAVMLGLLAGSQLQDRVVHLSHSCDLDPFTNPGRQVIQSADELRRQQKLQQVCDEGIAFFGPFAHLREAYNCRTGEEDAVRDLTEAINASSADDPLWILEAGEPDVIGLALERAERSARPHVHVVSHHPANDNSGDRFSWQEILDFGVTEHQIGDQNRGLQTAPSEWDWARGHARPALTWVWKQLEYAEQDGVVTFQTDKFDCSDAGILFWWITGANDGGVRDATPDTLKPYLLNAVSGAHESKSSQP